MKKNFEENKTVFSAYSLVKQLMVLVEMDDPGEDGKPC